MSEISRQSQDDQEPLPTSAADLLQKLDALGIAYELHEHEPVFTVAESTHLNETIPGLHCRNLYLRDKKKRNYLVVAGNDTMIDLKKLQKIIGSDRLSFGSAERLWQYLGVRPGSVCPFAVINDNDQAVEIILEQDMLAHELVNYHPMENHLTVSLHPDDLMKFIKSCGHEPRVIDLKAAAPDEKE